MKLRLLTITLLGMFLFISCSATNGYKDYKKIKTSSLTGVGLLNELSVFEIKNTGNFESKVDLGTYYLSVGDYGSAAQYLSRAESVRKNAHRGKERPKYFASLYGALAYLFLHDGDFDKALSYAEKAVKTGKDSGSQYVLLKARILASQNKSSDALAIFDKAYVSKQEMNLDEQRSYMALLANAGRYDEASVLLIKFFQQGGYYPGFGLFASTVSEKVGKADLAILYAFLDYEYHRDGNTIDDSAFLERLDIVAKKAPAGDEGVAMREAILAVKSRFDKKVNYSSLSQKANFVYEYIFCLNSIRDGNLSDKDFTRYLALEKMFCSFPSYYWGVWQVVSGLSNNVELQYSPVLMRIIALSPEGVYGIQARIAIGEGIGLSNSDSAKLLIPAEVDGFFTDYLRTGDDKNLKKIFDLFSLPDNDYVFKGMSIAKTYVENPRIRNFFIGNIASVPPRTKERLAYLLDVEGGK
jgi:tetratricopeptide (TPR) repeat protein